MSTHNQSPVTVKYGNEELDIYDVSDSGSTRPLVVYVHGGAWRGESKELHAGLAISLREKLGCSVAVVEYRLSTLDNNLRHPTHAKDVLDALEFLLSPPAETSYDPTRLYLVGHSAGGHILTSIFLAGGVQGLEPSDALLRSVEEILVASGIHDIDQFILHDPAYEELYIRRAFPLPYDQWNTTRYPLYAGAQHIRWHFVHSIGDVLVSRAQSEAMYDHLRKLYQEANLDKNRITKDYETITEHHHYVREPSFALLVADWVSKDMQATH